MARKTVSKPELHALVAQHGQAGAADILGVTPASVSKRLSTEGRRDSVETLRRARIQLVAEQTKKTKAHNDLVAGRTVLKENVNQLILRHAERFNTALRQLRLIDQTHGTSAASTLMECYEGFGDDVETILNRKPVGDTNHV